MDKQQHAIRLAEWLEESPNSMDKLSATELRRLHQVNQELVEALNTLVGMAESFPTELHSNHPDVITAKAILAKHKEQE